MRLEGKNDIIKIIWVPGSGKSFLLKKLRETLPRRFNFIEFWQEVEKRAAKTIHEGWTQKKSNAESLIEEIILYDAPTILTYHTLRRDGKKYEKDLQLEEIMNGVGYIYVYAKPEHILKRRMIDKANRIRDREMGDIQQIKEHNALIRKDMMALQEKMWCMYLEIVNDYDNVQENIGKMKGFVYKAFWMQ